MKLLLSPSMCILPCCCCRWYTSLALLMLAGEASWGSSALYLEAGSDMWREPPAVPREPGCLISSTQLAAGVVEVEGTRGREWERRLPIILPDGILNGPRLLKLVLAGGPPEELLLPA
jgi:hypothetical protein